MRTSIVVLMACAGSAAWAVAQSEPTTRPLTSLPLVGTRPVETRAVATRPVTKTDLNATCPVVWRGTPLKEALAELADRLGVRYILDAAIPAALLEEPVRMSAQHLTGQQAFRWLARTGGVSAVLVDGMFLVAPDDRLPLTWQVIGAATPGQRASEEARWARIDARRMDVTWIDTPLTGVAEDVSSLFGVDVIYHPAIQADPKLVYMRESGVGLERVREVLGRQLNVRTELYDGAMWVYPHGETVHWLRALGSQPALAMSQPDDFRMPPLDMWLIVDRSVTTWSAFAEAVSAVAGVPCVVDDEQGQAYPGLETAGSVAEILDGLRLLGKVVWNIAPEGPASGPQINLKVREKARDF